MRRLASALRAADLLLKPSTVEAGWFQSSHLRALATAPQSNAQSEIKWVFLGPPGVGKGTYATRASKHFGAAHIATGDLIRDQIKQSTPIGAKVKEIVNQGKLVPDEMIFELLYRRMEHGRELGERGFILDGFPRTKHQAEELLQTLDIQLALNMSLREEVLVEKCLGRRMCRKCGKNYNIADIYLPASQGRPEIRMPPLSPPAQCVQHLEIRSDDTEEVVRRRLQVYHTQAEPVEQVFRSAGLLLDFEITAGIPETLPGLLETLKPYAPVASVGGSQRHNTVSAVPAEQPSKAAYATAACSR